jgi:hypothetical protein
VSVTVEQPAAALAASATVTQTVSCNTADIGVDDDGAIALVVTGGTVDYTYAWTKSSGTFPARTTEDISGLEIGEYTVTVTDANSCTATATVTVGAPTPLVINTPTVPPIVCNGGTTTVTFTATDGTPDYTGLGPFTVYAGDSLCVVQPLHRLLLLFALACSLTCLLLRCCWHQAGAFFDCASVQRCIVACLLCCMAGAHWLACFDIVLTQRRTDSWSTVALH